jgi:aspartyl/asparaginyl beta-hydroxylase (cupin superfamily)
MFAPPAQTYPEGQGWIDPLSYPELDLLETRWKTVRDELFGVVNAQASWLRFTDDDSVAALRLKSQAEVSEIIRRALVPLNDDTPHKLFPLIRERDVFPFNSTHCPETVALLSSIPALFNAAFAALEPNGHIARHQGSSDRLDRCHLGLKIPEGDAKLKVGDRARCWQEGTLMLFDDRTSHEAWNYTSERRFVLIIDLEKALARDRRPLNMDEERFDYEMGKRSHG